MIGLEGFFPLLFALLVVHAIADYPLQGDFLAKAKNHANPIPGVPWWQAMGAHAVIHGGGVLLVTGSTSLAMAEILMHAAIDYLKCEGEIGYNADQALHIVCKVAWAAMAAAAAPLGGLP